MGGEPGSVLGQLDPFGRPLGTQKAPGWANKTYYYVLYIREVLWGPLNPSRPSPGAQELFSQLGSVLGQMDPFGPPVGTQKVPGWANKTYYYVLYM